MQFGSAETHFAECLQIAEEGRKKKLGVQLGVVYDQLCRYQWAENAARRLEGFDVNEAASKRDEE